MIGGRRARWTLGLSVLLLSSACGTLPDPPLRASRPSAAALGTTGSEATTTGGRPGR